MRSLFRPEEHIRRRPEFQRVQERGVRINGRLMTAILLANDRPHDRLGIVASRRVGGAVRRNRAKRLIREIFRLNKDRVSASAPAENAGGSGFDIVVIPRTELLDASFEAITADFRDILNRHAKRVRP